MPRDAAAARAAAVEALEDLLVLAGREPRAAVEHAQAPGRRGDRHGRRRRRSRRARSRSACRARARRRRARPTRAPLPSASTSTAMPCSRAGARPARGGRARELGQVELLAGRVALARARQDQQLVDGLRQPVDLAQRRVDLVRGVGGHAGRARLLEPQPQARERRAQLVRRVGDELALRRAARPASRAVISLNEFASDRCSVVPATGARRSRSAAGDLARGRLERRRAAPTAGARSRRRRRARSPARARPPARGPGWRAAPRR